MLDRVDSMHSRCIVHCDIKPGNFVVGLGDRSSTIYCIDFGLSKPYCNLKTRQHHPYNPFHRTSLTGTARYASIHNHLGYFQTRRDDLESIGYCLVYFLKGSLPWQGLPKLPNHHDTYKKILEIKKKTPINDLCRGLPAPFAEFLTYARSLAFDQKPDIAYLRKIFRDLFYEMDYHLDVSSLFPFLHTSMPSEYANNTLCACYALLTYTLTTLTCTCLCAEHAVYSIYSLLYFKVIVPEHTYICTLTRGQLPGVVYSVAQPTKAYKDSFNRPYIHQIYTRYTPYMHYLYIPVFLLFYCSVATLSLTLSCLYRPLFLLSRSRGTGRLWIDRPSECSHGACVLC